MKYINKFIVAGLGFALMFTGTSFVHGMFTSTAVQENIVMVPKANIVVDTNKKVYFYGKSQGGQKFNQLYIPVIIRGIDSNKLDISAKVQIIGNSTPITIENITVGKGVHPEVNGYPSDINTDCIIINSPSNLDFGVKENYNITVTVTINGSNKIIFNETYGVEKTNQGNAFVGTTGKRGQYINLVEPSTVYTQEEGLSIEENESNEDKINNELEVMEPSDEKVEKPSEPEVIEPPKEEIEKPSEPEVIEPPKEEIIEIPKQPEAIEPPKENEEIQE